MSGMSNMALVLAGAAGFGLMLLLQLIFIIVVATVVRRYRPDVAPILLLALSLEVVVYIGTYVGQFLLTRMVVGGVTQYAEVHALVSLASSLGHGMARGLLIWGTVRLAAPPSSA